MALETAGKVWTERRSLLVRISRSDGGPAGFGEVAPLPEFGSETLETAAACLRSLGSRPSPAVLNQALREVPPATAFALWAALRATPSAAPQPVRSAALSALRGFTEGTLAELRGKGYRTFKLKVAGPGQTDSWQQLKRLAGCLESGERLRLDPNQSWNPADWAFWEPRLRELGERLEFVEDPFPGEALSPAACVELAGTSQVPLALDESLSRSGPDGWKTWKAAGWPGFWVLKASLLGDPDNWIPLARECPERIVLSSVFETGLGMSALLDLAARFPQRDHGLGTPASFDDGWGPSGSHAWPQALNPREKEALWKRICQHS